MTHFELRIVRIERPHSINEKGIRIDLRLELHLQGPVALAILDHRHLPLAPITSEQHLLCIRRGECEPDVAILRNQRRRTTDRGQRRIVRNGSDDVSQRSFTFNFYVQIAPFASCPGELVEAVIFLPPMMKSLITILRMKSSGA